MGDVVSLSYRAPYLQKHFTDFITPDQALSAGGDLAEGESSSLEASALRSASLHVIDFLSRANPDLGRFGPVCPFTTGAMLRAALHLTTSRLADADLPRLMEGVVLLRTAFLEDRSGSAEDDGFRSVVVTYPHLPNEGAPGLITQAQKALKLSFVEHGLMVGEFYPGCSTGGIHNQNFRPLEFPVTSLAVRHINLLDAPFMLEDDACASAYLARFGELGERRLKNAERNRDRLLQAA